MSGNSTAIGIHLGSSFACVGVVKNGAVEIVANDLGDRTTACRVAYDSADAAPTVGRAVATREHASNFKAQMGSDAEVKAGARTATPVELSAAVVDKLRSIAAHYLGTAVEEAVIAVPAAFSAEARAATRQAAEKAGLNVTRVLTEPVAAAIAYGLDEAEEGDENVLVLRCGASTTDATVLRRSDGLFRVLGHGAAAVGGNDLDEALTAHFAKAFLQKSAADVSQDERARERLRQACQRAKHTLSSSAKAHVQVDSLLEGKDFFGDITRARFEMLCSEKLRGVGAPIDAALEEAGLNRADVARVLLVGGACKVPKVCSVVRGLFAETEAKILNEVMEDEAVAFGAATQAHLLARGPACRSPEEDGAGQLRVTALTLGVRASHGVMAPVVPRGTAVPCRRTRVFTSSADAQESVAVEVVEGERVLAANGRVLGRFVAPLEAKADRGESQVVVAFDIDAEGAVTVSAGGVTLKLAGSAAGEEEVRTVLADAGKAAAQDATDREHASVCAALESLTYALRNAHHTERVPADKRPILAKAIEESARWLEANPEASTADLQSHLDALVEEVAPLLKQLYTAKEDAAEESGDDESEDDEDEDSDEDSDLD